MADGADGETGLRDAARLIVETIRTYHYNPQELDSDEYRAIEQRILTLGETAGDDDEFRAGFGAIWRNGPFSHVNLSPARGSIPALVAGLDAMEVGPDAVQLEWRADTAVLTVNTMMGTDTIEAIGAAYGEIAQKQAERVIIDLRANGGGAFAIRPLVGHVLDEPYDAGVFVAQKWAADNDAPPVRSDLDGVEPWDGWSIRAFWDTAQAEPMVRVQLPALAPHYDGPVYVLVSKRTASAAELAAEALQGSGRALIIGETTAGQMLSQRPYDIDGRFHLFLPIADYYSWGSGRVEGVGVVPDIAVEAQGALDHALGL